MYVLSPTDPEVPPLPPHITLDQARAFTSTLLKGDPAEDSIVAGAVRQALAALKGGEKS